MMTGNYAMAGNMDFSGAMLHKGRAISRLRKDLSQPMALFDGFLVLGMVLLGFLEAMQGDVPAYEIHLQYARNMLQGKDGLQMLRRNTALKRVLDHIGPLTGHHMLEGVQPEETLQKFADLVDDVPLTTKLDLPSALTATLISTLPTGFQSLAQKRYLSSRKIFIIARLEKQVDCPQTINLWDDGIYSSFAEAFPALVSSPGTPENERTSLERLICMALIRFTCNGILPAKQGGYPLEAVAGFLCSDLQATETCAGSERDVRLWIWLIAIDACSIGLALGELSLQGTALLLSTLPMKFPEIYSWKAAHFENLGKAFFWRENMSRWLQKYWQPTTQARVSLELGSGRSGLAPMDSL